MRKQEGKDSGDAMGGKRKRSVFFQRKEKVLKEKKLKERKAKSEKRAKEKEAKKSRNGKKSRRGKKSVDRATPALPEWAVDFLKPSKMKREAAPVGGGLVLASEEMPLLEENHHSVQNIFSLSIPVNYNQDEDGGSEEMDSMPRFSPQGVCEGGTVDPPSLVGGVKDCLVEVIVSQL